MASNNPAGAPLTSPDTPPSRSVPTLPQTPTQTPASPASPSSVASGRTSRATAPRSSSGDDGYRNVRPQSARRLVARLRRASPTPDVITSLVRPPSPDRLIIGVPPLQTGGEIVQDEIPPTASFLSANLLPNVVSENRTGPSAVPHLSSLDIPRRYGGECVFDMYCLTYVSEPDSSLYCPICHDPLVDPVTTPCDHTFCYRCLRQSLDSSPSGPSCPIDRIPLVWPNCFSAARLIRTQLNNLIVKCPYHGRGCKKEVRREVVETHATTDCKYKDFACPDSNCKKRLRSKPTDDICSHKDTHCSNCNAGIDAAERDFHLLTCKMSKTRCQWCWKLVPRGEIDDHLDADCDGVVIRCPYNNVGCPTRVMRGNLNTHTLICGFHPDTASGMIIRTQNDTIKAYNEMNFFYQQIQDRQEETARQVNDLVSLINRMPSGSSLRGDNRTMQDLDAGFEEVHQNLTHLEARQSMWTLNQIMPIREEVTELRNNINMIRMHVNWLLNRSREEGRVRATNNTGTSAGLRRDDGAGHVPPERRRSSGSENADLPRL